MTPSLKTLGGVGVGECILHIKRTRIWGGRVLWVEVHPSPHSYVEILTPGTLECGYLERGSVQM